MRGNLSVRGLLVLLMLTIAAPLHAAAKPPVPPGADPGGGAIGLVTTGIDYTEPTVARCLARDGEGRFIAWDVVDRDPLPYRARQRGQRDDSELAAAIDCAGAVRLVPVRINPADPLSYSRALAFLSTTPARVVVLPQRNQPQDWGPFLRAAAEFKRLLIVIAATGDVAHHPAAGFPNIAFVVVPGDSDASMLALGHAVALVACAPRATVVEGAAVLAPLLAAQITRTPADAQGRLKSPSCH